MHNIRTQQRRRIVIVIRNRHTKITYGYLYVPCIFMLSYARKFVVKNIPPKRIADVFVNRSKRFFFVDQTTFTIQRDVQHDTFGFSPRRTIYVLCLNCY